MPATVLAERVGWSGFPAWFRENVTKIRRSMRRRTPRTGSPTNLGIRRCAICGPRMLPSRMIGHLLAGMWELIGLLARCLGG